MDHHTLDERDRLAGVIEEETDDEEEEDQAMDDDSFLAELIALSATTQADDDPEPDYAWHEVADVAAGLFDVWRPDRRCRGPAIRRRRSRRRV